MNIIIHVDGVQGSGKTYIISKIKNIKCVDTDDIMNKAIRLSKTPGDIKKIEKSIVNEYIKNNNKILFTGMNVDIPNPTHKYFIKIENLQTVYKRLLLRELEKINMNYQKLKKYINFGDNLNEKNIRAVANMSVGFPYSYDMFLEDYQMLLKIAKDKKYQIKTQDQIIKDIQSLF